MNIEIKQCVHLGCLQGWFAVWEHMGKKYQSRIMATMSDARLMAEHWSEKHG